MKPSVRKNAGLLGLWVLGCGFAMHVVGNLMWAPAAWLALLLTLRFVRQTPAQIGLPLAVAGWALAYCAGWSGVLPFQGWMAWAVPAVAGAVASIPFVLDKLLGVRVPYGTRWLILPLGWVATEAGFRLAGAGSWGALAYSQIGFEALLQGMAVLGLAWPALVIASFASVANALWEQPAKALKPAITYGLFLGLALVEGDMRQGPSPVVAGGDGPSVRVAGVVVDNREAFQATWGPLSYGEVLDAEALEAVRPAAQDLFDALLAQSAIAANQGARLIVWSEGNALVPASDEARLTARAQDLARAHGVWLFASMAVMTEGQSKAENIITVIDDKGRIIDRYLKSHPTPGEASVRGDGRMGWADTPYGRVAWAICYDFDYPELVAQAGRAKVDLLIDPSWDSPGMTPLHSDMATLRSLETGASLFRVVNDGLNIASNPTGQTLSKLKVERGHDALWMVDMPRHRRAAIASWVEPYVGMMAGLGLVVLGGMGAGKGAKRPTLLSPALLRLVRQNPAASA